MKRIIALGLLSFFLLGCNAGDAALNEALSLRNLLLQSERVTFDAQITADYGDEYYVFTVQCEADSTGDLTFEVLQPESIGGIKGRIRDEGGDLTFDEEVLAFETIADGQITPITAPWVFLKALRGGYICAGSYSDEGNQVLIDDTYEDNALKLEILLVDGLPTFAEIYWNQRRIICLEIENFCYA